LDRDASCAIERNLIDSDRKIARGPVRLVAPSAAALPPRDLVGANNDRNHLGQIMKASSAGD
jgi:hypothetical protein